MIRKSIRYLFRIRASEEIFYRVSKGGIPLRTESVIEISLDGSDFVPITLRNTSGIAAPSKTSGFLQVVGNICRVLQAIYVHGRK